MKQISIERISIFLLFVFVVFSISACASRPESPPGPRDNIYPPDSEDPSNPPNLPSQTSNDTGIDDVFQDDVDVQPPEIPK